MNLTTIENLAEEFENKFTCLRKNAEKPVPLEKGVTKIDKNGEEITKTTSYRLKFIDSARFTAS